MSAASINMARDDRGWPLDALGVSKHRLRQRWADRRWDADLDADTVAMVTELLDRPTTYYRAQALELFAEVVMVTPLELELAGATTDPDRLGVRRADTAVAAQARVLVLVAALKLVQVGGDDDYRPRPHDRVLRFTASHVLDRQVIAELCDGTLLLGHRGRADLPLERAPAAELVPLPWNPTP